MRQIILLLAILCSTPVLAQRLCAYDEQGRKYSPQRLQQEALFRPIQYQNAKGQTVIPLAAGYQAHDLGDFSSPCFRRGHWLYNGIRKEYEFVDTRGKVWYQIYWLDMGTDIPKEGRFRIRQHGLIGFADEKTGKVVIPAQFQAAFPFENGRAKVAY